MSARFFLDTNVLVYTFDSSSQKKKQVALRLVHRALAEGRGIISWQVVQEFLNVARRKFAVPLSAADSERYLVQVLAPLCEVYPDISLFKSALGVQDATGFGFCDSLRALIKITFPTSSR
jgi:predicted nucleic acid-binding protein